VLSQYSDNPKEDISEDIYGEVFSREATKPKYKKFCFELTSNDHEEEASKKPVAKPSTTNNKRLNNNIMDPEESI
jgi:hypothetical protein